MFYLLKSASTHAVHVSGLPRSAGFSMLPMLFLSSCSSVHQARQPFNLSGQPVAAAHVVTAGARVSGIAMSPFEVIIAAHSLPGSGYSAVVEGFPVIASFYGKRADDADLPAAQDYLVLSSAVPLPVTPLELDLNQDVHLGDEVAAVGFRSRMASSDPNRYWSFPSTTVNGIVVERCPLADWPDDVVTMRVPFDEYRGFSGAPALKKNAEGRWVVVGIVTWVGARWSPWDAHGYLGVAPLKGDHMLRRKPAPARTLAPASGDPRPTARQELPTPV